jgi:hypothetical protein
MLTSVTFALVPEQDLIVTSAQIGYTHETNADKFKLQ